MSEAGRTRVVHCLREPFDIYIGRSTPRYPELRATGRGNPFLRFVRDMATKRQAEEMRQVR